MKHPSSANVYKVIKTLESVLPLIKRENHLNMFCGSVNGDYSCGTIHCHGGWYAIASKLHENKIVDYENGADQMAKDLGFVGYVDLLCWARENKKIWGNKFPQLMFSDEMAFYHKTKRPLGAENLQHIIDHWREVAEKLKRLENKNKKTPSYPDITKKLAAIKTTEEKSDLPVKKKRAKQTS